MSNNNNKKKRTREEVSSDASGSDSEAVPANKKIKIEKETNNAEALNETKDGKGGNKDGAPLEKEVNSQRYRALFGTLNKKPNGPIVYWMSRDQRVEDNWALLYAQQLANHGNPNSKKSNPEKQDALPVAVVFNMVPTFLNATKRHYAFMLKGLKVVEAQLKALNIPFFMLEGNPYETIHQFAKKHKVSHIVTDFSPLRISREWKDKLIKNLSTDYKDCVVHEVDTHNIVPIWVASPKQEVGARTLRPKIHKLLPTFLTEFPKLVKQETNTDWQKKQLATGVDWDRLLKWVDEKLIDVAEIDWAEPGPEEAINAINSFIEKRLKSYASSRNDPAVDAQSNLSPYFHYGNVAAQRVALQVKPLRNKHPESVDSFLEESIVRRELSDNFCFYNKNYDSFAGFANWAQQTLNDHKKDKRPFIYTQDELEHFKTHDHLWNACQLEMVRKGKMHGFMRMYWAKKILEWTESPEEALRIAIYLNDKYEMDGRDPNGYVGCAWAIGGVHDQGWAEREIFGKIRYMNYAGCKRKFDIGQYIVLCRKFLTKEEEKKFTKDLVPISEKNSIKATLKKSAKK
jgi:deoxyribodipyrimidine photo-lyase